MQLLLSIVRMDNIRLSLLSEEILMRFYEDIVVNLVEKSQAVALCETEITDFAKKYDPQYFHIDPVAAKSSPFGGLIASGTHTIAHWSSLNHKINGDVKWICGLGLEDVRFLTPLRPNVPVYATSKCLNKRLSKSDPTRGVVVFEYELVEEDGDVVLSLISTNLVETKFFKKKHSNTF